MHNERYRGIYIYDDIRIEGGIPRIVSSTKGRLLELEAEQARLTGQIAAGRADIITISRDDVIAGLEMFRDGDVSDKKYQAKLFDTFLVAVYVYDDDLKIVFSFSGQKNTVRVPLDAALVDGIESSAEGKVRIKTLLSHQRRKVADCGGFPSFSEPLGCSIVLDFNP